MVEWDLAKVQTRVRFPSPAKVFSSILLFISFSHTTDLKIVQISTSAKQGELIYLRSEVISPQANLSLNFLGKDVPCYQVVTKKNKSETTQASEITIWECFMAIPADSPIGKQTIKLLDQDKAVMSVNSEIIPTAFPIEPIVLSEEKKSLLSKEDRPQDLKKIKQALKSESKTKKWEKEFLQPIQGKIESLYGEKRILDGELKKGYHRGLDLGAPEGAPIKAANHGEVILAGEFIEEGNMVMIDHGQGFITAYLHCSKILVRKGKKVKKGEVIGEVGSTGVVNTPHLHFGTYIHGAPIDPLYLLNKFSYN